MDLITGRQYSDSYKRLRLKALYEDILKALKFTHGVRIIIWREVTALADIQRLNRTGLQENKRNYRESGYLTRLRRLERLHAYGVTGNEISGQLRPCFAV